MIKILFVCLATAPQWSKSVSADMVTQPGNAEPTGTDCGDSLGKGYRLMGDADGQIGFMVYLRKQHGICAAGLKRRGDRDGGARYFSH